MRVHFTSVGAVENPPNVEVDLDVIPREGEQCAIWPELAAHAQIVRTVIWNVTHNEDPEDETPCPNVYIVIGTRRPEY